jgi:cytoskeletal protein CcmA (bactofilin family)
MNIEHGKIEGDLRLDHPLVLHGMVTGTITVVSGGVLALHGMCSRLVIEPGGEVELHGTVGGNVTNRGGNLQVYGTIGGLLWADNTEHGSSVVHRDAVVNGGVSLQD